MFRLRLIAREFGVDEGGPLHPSREDAVRAAKLMLQLHPYPIRAEIRQCVDTKFRRSKVVEVLES